MISAERIRAARDAKGWTQRELASRLGLSDDFGPMQISHWENGYKVPNARNLVRLADELSVSVDYILGVSE